MSLLGRWGAVGSAVLALPGDLFDPFWLLLFCLPGVVFLLLSLDHWRKPLVFAERLAVTAVAEIGLSFAIYQTAAAPVPQAALTYLLLAPLAYATLRRRDVDVLHSLFLAFCLLLIAAILRGSTPVAQIIAFIVCASAVLQGEAQNPDAFDHPFVQIAQGTGRGRWLRRGSVTLACLFAFSGLFELLQHMPSPARSQDADRQERRVGVSTRFDLASSRGPLNLVDDELVTAHDPAGPMRTDLYLRCGYFDVAGIDRWDVRKRSSFRDHDLTRSAWERRAVRGATAQRLVIHRMESISGLIYVPPGTFRIRSVQGDLTLRASSPLEAFYQVDPRDAVVYELRYQNLRPYAADRDAIEPEPHLTHLPPELERRRDLVRLARSWVPRGSRSTARVAEGIAHGLAERCTYALEEPLGSSPHALINFLFGNREGFCMHFASAMAILLRLEGVPCRIAVGLYGGRAGDTEQQRVFGSAHAHAWVEVPLAGLGWVVFDPTPAASLSSDRPRWPEQRLATPLPDGSDRDAESAPNRRRAPGIDLPLAALWPWVGLAVLMVLALFRPQRPLDPLAASVRITPEGRTARRLLTRILGELGTHGHPRLPGVPLERYLVAVGADERVDVPVLGAAFRAYQDVRFGERPLDDERSDALNAGWDAARALR